MMINLSQVAIHSLKKDRLDKQIYRKWNIKHIPSIPNLLNLKQLIAKWISN